MFPRKFVDTRRLHARIRTLKDVCSKLKSHEVVRPFKDTCGTLGKKYGVMC